MAPEFGGQGIGSSILQRLEQLAKERGCAEIRMDSSLTAEPFYRRYGYEVIERSFHRLRTGREMACVKMRKAFK